MLASCQFKQSLCRRSTNHSADLSQATSVGDTWSHPTIRLHQCTQTHEQKIYTKVYGSVMEMKPEIIFFISPHVLETLTSLMPKYLKNFIVC